MQDAQVTKSLEIHHILNFEKSTCDQFKYKMGNSIFYKMHDWKINQNEKG